MTANEARAFLIAMDAGTREALRRLNEYVEEKAQPHIDHEPWFKTNRDGEVKGKLVKVSDVIQVLHYMAAKMAFRALPNAWKRHVTEFIIRPGVKWLAQKAAKEAIKSIPSPKVVLQLIRGIAVVGEEALIEQRLEQEIRETVDLPRNQMNTMGLFQPPVPQRHRRNVRSRHKK